MAPRYLINESGEPFEDGDLERLAGELDSLSPAERTKYRNDNATAIAQHLAEQMLIVAGPGTGKSTIFKQRALSWLERDPDAKILALSFVRKLVADLNSDIQNDAKLSDQQKRQVDTWTLHKYARSLVEQNHGTREWNFAPHFRIIGQSWKTIVWHDVLLISGQEASERYSWKAFERQLHNDQFDGTGKWPKLKASYFALCRFYNAAGFSDLILRAREALAENSTLNEYGYFIVDEYQDFNAAEENLLNQITGEAKGTLIVGDDDQVLYETLKSGKASLIRAIYKNGDVVNAMLAFCSRCDFHITHTAKHFLAQGGDPECIKKIYLPLTTADGASKVHVVGCATPGSAVDFIRKFLEDHKAAIEQRQKDLASGDVKDAYLLILSPSGEVNFYSSKGARDELLELVESYRAEERSEFSEDYYTVLNYYSLANYPANNFTFRKVLHYEQISDDDLLALLEKGIEAQKPLSALDHGSIAAAVKKAQKVKVIVESAEAVSAKVEALAKLVSIADKGALSADLERSEIDKQKIDAVELQEEEDAELEEIEVQKMNAVELMTIVGSKGLSADHVIIIGVDNVNMNWVTRNAFFVAMTRARKSLHLITALCAGGAARLHDFVGQLPERHVEFYKYTKGRRQRDKLGNRRDLETYLRTLVDQGRRR